MKRLVENEFYTLMGNELESVFGGATYMIITYTDANGVVQYQIIKEN